jgi:hypothetical protein
LRTQIELRAVPQHETRTSSAAIFARVALISSCSKRFAASSGSIFGDESPAHDRSSPRPPRPYARTHFSDDDSEAGSSELPQVIINTTPVSEIVCWKGPDGNKGRRPGPRSAPKVRQESYWTWTQSAVGVPMSVAICTRTGSLLSEPLDGSSERECERG